MLKNKYTFLVTAILLVAVMALFLFAVKSTVVVVMPMLAISLAAMGMIPYSRWTVIDKCIVGITLFDICSCFYSITLLNAYYTANFSILMLVIYCLQRSIFVSKKHAEAIITGYAMVGAIAIVLAVMTFIIYHNAVMEAGYEETYSCRFMYRPLGYINNVWAEIAVAMLGLSCLAKRFKAPLMCLAATGVLMTFSRGAYISAALFLILISLIVRKRQLFMRIVMATIVAVSTVAVFDAKSMVTTLRINGNDMQRNSNEWRYSKTLASIEAVKLRPLFGYGSGSYTLVTDENVKSDDQNTFTDMAPNLPIKLLVEKGLVGTSLYLLLAFCMTLIIWKHRHDTQTCIAGCTLAALAVKELTQATLMEIYSLMFLVYSFLAYIQRDDQGKEERACDARSTTIVTMVLLSIWITFYVVMDITKCLHEKETGHLMNAIQLMKSATTNNKDIIRAEEELKYALQQHPQDKRIRFMLAYMQIKKRQYEEATNTMEWLLKGNPDYGLYQFTAAYTLYKRNIKPQALDKMATAICNMPQLIRTRELKEIMTKDRLFDAKLKETVLKRVKLHDAPVSTITKAKYGYILHNWGNKREARILLTEAITEMPNLPVTWLLLGDKKKYDLLNGRALKVGKQQAERNDCNDETDIMEILYSSYRPRFQTWYLTDLPL